MLCPFQDRLLLYSHERLIGGVENFKKTLEGGNKEDDKRRKKSKVKYWEMGDGPEAGKDYLLSLMFSHFDQNNNGALEYEELNEVSKLIPVDLMQFQFEFPDSCFGSLGWAGS